MLPDTHVTATRSASGEAAAYRRARLSSMPVSTSRMSGMRSGMAAMLPASIPCVGPDGAPTGRDALDDDAWVVGTVLDQIGDCGEEWISPCRLGGQRLVPRAMPASP